jgi:preprotein translocase subunit SecE
MRSRWRGAGRLRAASFSGWAKAALCAGSPKAHIDKAMTNPFEFIQQVRAEAAKVVWPTRRETLITTGLVLVLVVFTSLFFVVVDQVLRQVVSLALGFGRGG